MTGELYEILAQHSVLRHSLGGERDGPATEAGIAEGLETGLADPELLTALTVPHAAAALLDGKGADWCSGYLSGLLDRRRNRRPRATGWAMAPCR